MNKLSKFILSFCMCLVVTLSFVACNKKDDDNNTEPEEPVNYITYDEFKTYYTSDGVTLNWDNFDVVLNRDRKNKGSVNNLNATVKYRTVGDDKYIEIKSEADGKKGEIYAHNADTYVLIKNADGTEYLKKKSKINIFEAISSGNVQLSEYANDDEVDDYERELIRAGISDLDQLLPNYYLAKENFAHVADPGDPDIVSLNVSKKENGQKSIFKLDSFYKSGLNELDTESKSRIHTLTFSNNKIESIVTTWHEIWYLDSSNISGTTYSSYNYEVTIKQATGTIEMPTDLESYV